MTKKGDIFVADLKFKKQIVQELEQICRQPNTDDGKIRLERKSDLKKRLLRSPDFADMMMMRMLTEVNTLIAQKIIW